MNSNEFQHCCNDAGQDPKKPHSWRSSWRALCCVRAGCRRHHGGFCEQEIAVQIAVGGREGGELRDDPLPLQALDALQRARREGCWAGRAHGSRTLVCYLGTA